jgi:hypothetical protein
VDSSNFEGHSTFFFLKNLTLKDQIRLAIISWYIPEEIGFILRQDLEEIKRYLSCEDEQVISLLLDSKPQMELFLLETRLWHERDFFGNIIPIELSFLNRFFRIRKENKKVKKVQRKRGYHDHGSRVDDHKWLPSSDFSFTEKQNEIEAKRESCIDTKDYIVGFIT